MILLNFSNFLFRFHVLGIIGRVEYAGSRFKNTATGSSDYDNMLVYRDADITATPVSGHPTYYHLQKAGSPISRSTRLLDFRYACIITFKVCVFLYMYS